jgi:hypothetical protein
VNARSGTVHRFSVIDAAGVRRRYYLKQYAAAGPGDDFATRWSRLASIADRLRVDPHLTPFDVLGYDPERRLLLTGEMPGLSMVHVHQQLARRAGLGASAAVHAWNGVGRWLGALHRRTLPPQHSATRTAELADYTRRRLDRWREADPGHAALAAGALDALDTVVRHCSGGPLRLAPCHGDVTGFNIIVGRSVGLIDFDDLQFDLPAVDVSQAWLEIRHLAVLGPVPFRRFVDKADRALLAGYDGPLPDGAEFWLAHLRNLSVFLMTLSRGPRQPLRAPRAFLRYRRLIDELDRSVRRVQASDGRGSFWSNGLASTPPGSLLTDSDTSL